MSDQSSVKRLPHMRGDGRRAKGIERVIERVEDANEAIKITPEDRRQDLAAEES